jgi:hypothetical protein
MKKKGTKMTVNVRVDVALSDGGHREIEVRVCENDILKCGEDMVRAAHPTATYVKAVLIDGIGIAGIRMFKKAAHAEGGGL